MPDDLDKHLLEHRAVAAGERLAQRHHVPRPRLGAGDRQGAQRLVAHHPAPQRHLRLCAPAPPAGAAHPGPPGAGRASCRRATSPGSAAPTAKLRARSRRLRSQTAARPRRTGSRVRTVGAGNAHRGLHRDSVRSAEVSCSTTRPRSSPLWATWAIMHRPLAARCSAASLGETATALCKRPQLVFHQPVDGAGREAPARYPLAGLHAGQDLDALVDGADAIDGELPVLDRLQAIRCFRSGDRHRSIFRK